MFSQRNVALLLWLAGLGVANAEIMISSPPNDTVITDTVANDTAVNKKTKPVKAQASRNKTKAAESVQPATPIAPPSIATLPGAIPSSAIPITIQMNGATDVEEAILLPGRGEMQAILRAKNYGSARDKIPFAQHYNGSDAISAENQDMRTQLDKNSSKAKQYMNGTPVTSLASPNNIEAVACASIGNVSGRIGDDSISGREIIVIRDNQKVKMRCK